MSTRTTTPIGPLETALGEVSGSSSSSGGAPTNASYVTLGTNVDLTNERVLTAGTGISITDGGAGGNVTIDATGSGLTQAQVLARMSLGV